MINTKIPLLLTILLIFLINTGTWAQGFIETQKITASSRVALSNYGTSIVIDGNRAVVGAPNEGDFGAVYILERNLNGDWIEVLRIEDSNKVQFDRFGQSVALDGDLLVVGVPGHNIGATTDAGKLMVYERDMSGNWPLKTTLTDQATSNFAQLGQSAAIDSNVIVAGATGYSTSGINFMGRVAVFEEQAGSWSYETGFTPTTSAAANNAFMGTDVAIQGNRFLVSIPSQGTVRVYEKTTNWSLSTSLIDPSGNSSSYFGVVLDLDGDKAIIGAPNFNNIGAALLYQYISPNSWVLTDTFIPPVPTVMDQFGSDVDLKGNQLLIGANFEDEDANGANTLSDAGAAYLYEFDGSTWSFNQKLVSSDRENYDEFGFQLALGNDYALVAAPQEEHDTAGLNMLSKAGSLYAFELCNTTRTDVVVTCSPYSWYGNTYTASGVYSHTIPNPSGCDSVLTLDITFPHTRQNDTANVCGYYDWQGQRYFLSGTYYDTLTNAVGCDSLLSLSLTVSPKWHHNYQTPSVNWNIDGARDVAIYGNYAVVGHTYISTGGGPLLQPSNTGGYIDILERGTNGQWSIVQTITDTTLSFGYQVEMDSNYIMVAAYTAEVNGLSSAGKVIIYEKGTGSSWSYLQTLTSNLPEQGALFGYALKLKGDWLIVGEPSADFNNVYNSGKIITYLKQSNNIWGMFQAVTPSQQNSGGQFGKSLDLSNDTLIVGAPGTITGGASNAGQVYLFAYNTIWSPFKSLTDNPPTLNNRFGWSVAYANGTAYVGSPFRQGAQQQEGKIDVFRNTSFNNWSVIQTITGSSGVLHASSYGWRIEVEGNWAFISDHTQSVGTGFYSSGQVTAYQVNPNGTLSGLDNLIALDRRKGDLLGNNISVSGNRLIAAEPNKGAVYIFEPSTFNITSTIQEICNGYTWNGQYLDTEGVYTDTIPHPSGGCPTLDAIHIIDISPNPTVYSNNGTLYSNDVVQWLDCNNNYAAISGANSNSFTPTTNGSYAAVVYNSGTACQDTSACYNFVMTNTSTLGTEHIQVYPNPTTGKVTIDLDKPYSNTHIQVSNVTGQVLQQVQIDQQSNLQLELEGQAGVYFIQIFNEKGRIASFKLIKS